MHERGPPKNVIMLPHTPGSAAAASGVFSQRSGLSRNAVPSVTRRYLEMVGAPELVRVLAPDRFHAVHGQDRNEEGLSLHDPDQASAFSHHKRALPKGKRRT